MRILLIEDEPSVRLVLTQVLRGAGHEVAVATDGHEGLARLRAHRFDLIVTDVRMPGPDGFAILEYATQLDPQPDVILMSAHGDIGDAVSALKLHAADYLAKPFDPEMLVRRIDQIGQRRAVNRDDRAIGQSDRGPRHGLIGNSAEIRRVRAQIDVVGASDAPVLISGESGTGKELVARALHAQSPRRDQPFVDINSAAFPTTLLEAELFGYERGAFTGADRPRQGRFAAAGSGTLFLDEIGEMPLSCQAKLLRVLQERVYSPLGTNKVLPVNARIVSASNRDLRELVQTREFREDLFYRIKVITIDLPTLRERKGDLVPLCGHFLAKFAGPDHALVISSAAWQILSEYDYPGNVRELEHAIYHAVVMVKASGGGEILPKHLPAEMRESTRADEESSDILPITPLASATKAYERQYLLRALALCHGNKTRTAKVLAISRKSLWEKVRNHAISKAEIYDMMRELPEVPTPEPERQAEQPTPDRHHQPAQPG